MAKLEGVAGGFAPPPPPPKEKKVEKRKHVGATCDACGFYFEGSVYQKSKRFVTIDDKGEEPTYLCTGCTSHFQVLNYRLEGFPLPPMDYIAAKQRMAEIAEVKYALIKRTQSFAGVRTGANFTVELGDIFPILRCGIPDDGDGSANGSQRKFSIDVQVGNEALTLFPHEVIPIEWTMIMQLRQDKDYTEAFLSSDDPVGYFTPTESFREELTATFGDGR